MEDRLFITVWYRVSATLTSRMKGCRLASREPAAAGARAAQAEGRTSRGGGRDGETRAGVKRG